MARRPLMLLICLAAFGAVASPFPSLHRIREDGRWSEYEVALDEIHEARLVRKIPAERDADAVRASLRGNAGAELILYPKGGPRDETTRRFLTRDIAVQVQPGIDPKPMVGAVGGRVVRQLKSLPGWWLVRSTGEAGHSLGMAAALRRQPGILAAEPQLARQQSKRSMPNDPLFIREWHLLNTGQSKGTFGIDANVTPAWDLATGIGVRIGIVDDGLENTHPDISPNYAATLSHDFNSDDDDPSPPPFLGDSHGTSCAGVAAAAGNNQRGVCGVAYNAKLVGLRLIAAPATDLEEAEAFAYHVGEALEEGEETSSKEIHIKSNSWGPFDDARRLEGPGPLARAALSEAVRTGRGGLGTIFVWAAGNGRQSRDDSNYDGYANARETIAVGAYTNEDKQPFYSETGSNIVVVAPSSGGTLGIATTDRQGNDGYNAKGRKKNFPDRDYTDDFGGTSSATPLVAGVVALMLEVQPKLGWRDVQDILIRTARKTPGMAADPSDFVTNAAGLTFSRRFGAGLVDAAAAVSAAKNQVLLGRNVSYVQEDATILPINDAGVPVTTTLNFSNADVKVEHAVLTVDISHAARGQLEIKLRSPSGTESIVAPARPKDRGNDYKDWPFLSIHFWGEQAKVGDNGIWMVTVTDTEKKTVGSLNRVRLELFGTSNVEHVQLVEAKVIETSNKDLVPQPGERVSVEVTLKNESSEPIKALQAELLGTGGVGYPPAPVDFGELPAGETAVRTLEFDAAGLLGSRLVGTLLLKDDTRDLGTATFSFLLGTPGTLTSTFAPTLETPGFPRPKGNANQYPSTVTTTGAPQGSVITGVRLHLNHAFFQRSDEIDMLLAGPGQKTMTPISDAGLFADDSTLVLTDSATLPLPATSGLLDGEYRPTNYGPNDAFPFPAPPGPHASSFAVFNGLDPNGSWNLFVRDDGGRGRGGLGSWYVEVDYVY